MVRALALAVPNHARRGDGILHEFTPFFVV